MTGPVCGGCGHPKDKHKKVWWATGCHEIVPNPHSDELIALSPGELLAVCYCKRYVGGAAE